MGPPPDIMGETAAAKRASVALVVGIGAYALQLGASAITIGSTGAAFTEAMNSSGRRNRATTFGSTDGTQLLASAIQNLAGIAVLVVGILVVIWAYKAAENAVRLGYPAALSTGWAIGGWICPIVNWWFPYQSVRDLLPPGHPTRSLVGRWWGFWLVVSFSACFMVPFLFTGGGAAGPLVVAVIGALCAAAAGVFLRQIIAAVTADHTQGARDRFGYQG